MLSGLVGILFKDNIDYCCWVDLGQKCSYGNLRLLKGHMVLATVLLLSLSIDC